MAERWPLSGFTRKPAMLLWPRLGAYRNFPSGVIWIWEQEFLPSYPFGSVEIVWMGCRLPLFDSYV